MSSRWALSAMRICEGTDNKKRLGYLYLYLQGSIRLQPLKVETGQPIAFAVNFD